MKLTNAELLVMLAEVEACTRRLRAKLETGGNLVVSDVGALHGLATRIYRAADLEPLPPMWQGEIR